MIHELLLCLSGIPSPLLEGDLTEQDRQERVKQGNGIRALIDPAELALLQKLALGLGKRHRDVRENASRISASHPSAVGRAVAGSIISFHLAKFRERILQVEQDVLTKNSNIVGAGTTVPLSAVVSAFDGWERRLQWLLDITHFIQPVKKDEPSQSSSACTAAAMIHQLRDANLTGFPDIQLMSNELTKVAELAWLKQLSTWVIYGRLPDDGDLFVTKSQNDHGTLDLFTINEGLIPDFVTTATANSILFIGKSLNQIRDRKVSLTDRLAHRVTDNAFLPAHVSYLSKLSLPINRIDFSTAIRDIRLSLSQNALQKLLPIAQVVETLHILRDYFLLQRGEFAAALITAADKRLSNLQTKPIDKRVKELDGLADLANLTIREGEVQNVLSQAWTALTAINETDDDLAHEEVERAREQISLSIKSLHSRQQVNSATDREHLKNVEFDDLLLPTPTVMTIRISSPIDLFLAPGDVDTYSEVQAYLLALKRCQTRLGSLFLLSPLRREPKLHGQTDRLSHFRSLLRNMRPIWTTIKATTYFLSELTGYLQGEVVAESWAAFQAWVTPEIHAAPGSLSTSTLSLGLGSGRMTSRPSSSQQSDEVATWGIHDPDTLASAHRRFLSALRQSLLLNGEKFTTVLRNQMSAVDHLHGLMQRLSVIQTGLNALQPHLHETHLAHSEQKTLIDLHAARERLLEGNKNLISHLRELDEARYTTEDIPTDQSHSDEAFAPWLPHGLDRLLLKFDLANEDQILSPSLPLG